MELPWKTRPSGSEERAPVAASHNRKLASAPGTLATSIVILSATLITGIALSRGLGPAGRGEVAALLLWGYIAFDAGALGTPHAIGFFAAKAEPGEPNLGLAIARRAFPLLVTISIAVFLALAVGSDGDVKPSGGIVTIMIVWLVLFLVVGLLSGSAQGRGEMATFNIGRFLTGGSPAIGIVLLGVFYGLSVRSTLIVYALAQAAAAIVLVRGGFAERNLEPLPDQVYPKKEFWRYSLWNMASVMAVKGNRSFDLLLLSLAGSAEEIGFYAVAASSAFTVSIVGDSLGMYLFQRVARERDVAFQRSFTVRFLVITAGLSAAAATAYWLLAPTLIPLVYGGDFSAAVPPARILVIGGVLVSVSRLMGEALKALGSPRAVALSETAGAAATLAGLLLFGVDSLTVVATVAVAGYAVTTVLTGVLTARAFRLRQAAPLESRRPGTEQSDSSEPHQDNV